MGFGDFIGGIGTALHLPEFGISELLGGQKAGTGLGQNQTPGAYIMNGVMYNAAGDPIMTMAQPSQPQQPSQAYEEPSVSGGGADAGYYQDTIDQLSRLISGIGTQRQQGLDRIGSTFKTAADRLAEDRTRAMQGYDQQSQQNETLKLRGTEQVDSFANNSFNNLKRLLQGANAGNSSVGRELVPMLVSKAAGTRRQGVFNTFGENQQGIDQAREDATTQFDRSGYDLGEQRKKSEEDFLRGVGQQEADLYTQLGEAQSGLAGNRGAGAAARAAAAARENALNDLFNTYKPSAAPIAVNLKTPTLGQYTVDKAAVAGTAQGVPTESAAYLPALKKKQAGL